jgi:phosphatidate phosphatase APP1
LTLFNTETSKANEIGSSSQESDEAQLMVWHTPLAEKVRSSLHSLEEFADVHWRRFSRCMGFNEPRHIAAYRGYGNSETIWVHGRLLANRQYGGPADDDKWWDNLRATYQRWESDEVPNAVIRLTHADRSIEVRTDVEGYYDASFERDSKARRTDVVTAQHLLEDRVLSATHQVLLPDPQAEFLVVSDVDDTVIHTGITDLLLSAQLTFLHNAKTRKPLIGVASLYQALARGSQPEAVNPIVYVSNSAWNMYDLLRDFLDLNDLPMGPLMLRDLGLGTDSSDHKIDTIRQLLERFASLPVVLVGDSGQHDAEIYATLAEEYPGRVRAIYIRDVDPDEDSEYDTKVDDLIARAERAGVDFLRVQDSRQVAVHAAQIGLLPAIELEEISEDVELDRQRETVAEKASFGEDRE